MKEHQSLLDKTKAEAKKLEAESVRTIEKELKNAEKMLKEEMKRAIDGGIDAGRKAADAYVDKLAGDATKKANEQIDKGFNFLDRVFGQKLITVNGHESCAVSKEHFGNTMPNNKYASLMS